MINEIKKAFVMIGLASFLMAWAALGIYGLVSLLTKTGWLL